VAKKRRESRNRLPLSPASGGPHWVLIGLALCGTALAGYLTATAWGKQAATWCPAGSGCDIVLGSRWATLFGQPTSLWGMLTYVGLAGIAWIRNPELRWKLAWAVALFGALFSFYLTIISITVLKATCPYCLSSAALIIAILGLIAFERPKTFRRFAWRPWLLKTAVPSLLAVFALHFAYFTGGPGAVVQAENSRLRVLATHLAESGAKFYGTSWCPHCQEQKKLFGASAHRLPYIECSPSGRSRPQATYCRDIGIHVYPTWIINGRRYEGPLTLEQLIVYSGFPTVSAPQRNSAGVTPSSLARPVTGVAKAMQSREGGRPP
jgi:uncharacterized membrane protein/glutaredoxin